MNPALTYETIYWWLKCGGSYDEAPPEVRLVAIFVAVRRSGADVEG